MNPSEYVKAAIRTECSYNSADERLLHGAMGMITEAGEIIDSLKKHIFYGKTLDKVNLVEEIGDTLWYIAILADELNMSIEDIMEININKLRKRYPEKFTQEAALNRDLDAERKVLEA